MLPSALSRTACKRAAGRKKRRRCSSWTREKGDMVVEQGLQVERFTICAASRIYWQTVSGQETPVLKRYRYGRESREGCTESFFCCVHLLSLYVVWRQVPDCPSRRKAYLPFPGRKNAGGIFQQYRRGCSAARSVPGGTVASGLHQTPCLHTDNLPMTEHLYKEGASSLACKPGFPRKQE